MVGSTGGPGVSPRGAGGSTGCGGTGLNRSRVRLAREAPLARVSAVARAPRERAVLRAAARVRRVLRLVGEAQPVRRARRAAGEARRVRRARGAAGEARRVRRARGADGEARQVRRARGAAGEARQVRRARAAVGEARQVRRARAAVGEAQRVHRARAVAGIRRTRVVQNCACPRTAALISSVSARPWGAWAAERSQRASQRASSGCASRSRWVEATVVSFSCPWRLRCPRRTRRAGVTRALAWPRCR